MTPYPERLNRFRVELEKAVALDLDRSRRRSRIVRPIAAALTLAAVIGVVGSIVLSGGGHRSSSARRPHWPRRVVNPSTWS